jgi:pimeloyl-ACP methyl ester carboxylesterase
MTTRVRRAVDVVTINEQRVVGTVHQPPGKRAEVGLLWLNFGYVPRDGHGGLAAQAADAMAARGVTCFRYDLPMLGDSPGELPDVAQGFFDYVHSGQATSLISPLIELLCEREGLSGLVLGGLCGGAVMALFAADVQPRVRGLVLLEPEMYVTEPPRNETPVRLRSQLRARLPREGRLGQVLDAALERPLPLEETVAELIGPRLPLNKLRGKLFSYWGWMRVLTHENRYARFIPLPRKAILDFVLSHSELPSVTNLPLAAAWQRFVTAKRPALVITAEGKLREVFFERINATVLAGVEGGPYQHVRLAGTNHIFTTGGAIQTVIGHLQANWHLFQ